MKGHVTKVRAEHGEQGGWSLGRLAPGAAFSTLRSKGPRREWTPGLLEPDCGCRRSNGSGLLVVSQQGLKQPCGVGVSAHPALLLPSDLQSTPHLLTPQ